MSRKTALPFFGLKTFKKIYVNCDYSRYKLFLLKIYFSLVKKYYFLLVSTPTVMTIKSIRKVEH